MFQHIVRLESLHVSDFRIIGKAFRMKIKIYMKYTTCTRQILIS